MKELWDLNSKIFSQYNFILVMEAKTEELYEEVKETIIMNSMIVLS